MTQFQRISKLRKKTVSVDEKAAADLEKFARYISEKQGERFSVSDILSTLFIADFDKRLRFPKPKPKKDLGLKLPDTVWKNLQKKALEFSTSEANLIEKVADLKARDKGFQEWEKIQKESVTDS